MGISRHLETFNNKKVVNYEPEMKIDPSLVYRISTNYNRPSYAECFEAFFAQPNTSELEELIIGAWNPNIGEGWEPDIEGLVAQKDKLPNLKYLFIGDITDDECEMSWISAGDYSGLIEAFPNLIHLQCRGGEEEPLTFGELKHENLETLIIETGGLHSTLVDEIFEANLPKLTHLELWLGCQDYGFDCSLKTFKPLLNAELFPNLTYLGLNNSEIVNEIAKALLTAPILDKIETLDLSGGNLTDEGAQHLLDNPKIKNLKHLNLRHHFLSEEMEAKFQEALGDKVNLSQSMRGRYYYIEVGE